MKRFILILALLFISSMAYAEAIQVDCFLAGMRDPATDEPLNGGSVETYEAGTSTPAYLYLDRDETSNASFPFVLDAYGRAEVFGNGIYRFVVKNASGTTIWEMDGMEYKAVLTTTGQAALTEDLDAAGFKIINLDVGVDPDDSATFGQLTDVSDDLTDLAASFTSEISDVRSEIGDLTFTDLTDTPATYTAQALLFPRVNAAETALEFVDVSTVVTSGTPTGAAGGDLSGTYPDPVVQGLQGEVVSSATPALNEVLSYDGSKWAPAVVPGGLVRYLAWTGFSTSVTINDGVDYNGTPVFASIVFDFGADCIAMFDIEQAAGVGFYRIINRGGENADRVYDGAITVSTTASSVTLGGRYIKSVVVYCQ